MTAAFDTMPINERAALLGEHAKYVAQAALDAATFRERVKIDRETGQLLEPDRLAEAITVLASSQAAMTSAIKDLLRYVVERDRRAS